MKRRLQQYAGRLTAAKIAEGMNAARKNASRLAADARLLFDDGRYPSALSLAILSIEEIGKEPILRALAIASDEADLKSAWRDYRSHTKKNVLWPIFNLIADGAHRAADFEKLFSEEAEHPHLLDNIKQLCFYTDCLGKQNWSVPQEVISRDLADMIVIVAELLVSSDKEITAQEVELWIQHLEPHWKKGNVARTAALFEWDKEMRRRGIAKGTVTMQEFFQYGIKNIPQKPPRSN